jgi:hypothetical protein
MLKEKIKSEIKYSAP